MNVHFSSIIGNQFKGFVVLAAKNLVLSEFYFLLFNLSVNNYYYCLIFKSCLFNFDYNFGFMNSLLYVIFTVTSV